MHALTGVQEAGRSKRGSHADETAEAGTALSHRDRHNCHTSGYALGSGTHLGEEGREALFHTIGL